jgi:hypothetical protein
MAQVFKTKQFTDYLGENRAILDIITFDDYRNRIAPIWTGIVSRTGTRPYSTIYSYDGITWLSGNTPANLVGDTSIGAENIITNGYIFVGSGVDTQDLTDVLVWSNDGITYYPSTNGNTFGFVNIRQTYWDGTRFLAVGNTQASPSLVTSIVQSYDGKTWSLIGTYNTQYTSMVMVDGVYYLTTTVTGSCISYTTDFVEFSEATTPPCSGSTTDITYNGTRFLSCGFGINNGVGTQIIYSDDGLNWTQSSTGPTSLTNNCMWDGSQFIVGRSGNCWTSPDGINFTERGGSNTNGTIFFDGNIYVAASTTGVRYSYDLDSWTLTSSLGGLTNTFSVAHYPYSYNNYPPIP